MAGVESQVCWVALRAVKWPPGGSVPGKVYSDVDRSLGVSWGSASDAKDANKRRPCQGKRCTMFGGRWGSALEAGAPARDCPLGKPRRGSAGVGRRAWRTSVS
jgi:hypothetical protein